MSVTATSSGMTTSLPARTFLAATVAVGLLGLAFFSRPSTPPPNPDDSAAPAHRPGATDNAAQRISILTYNLKTGSVTSPDVDARIRAVRRFIEREQPDAVALQEVSARTGAYNNIGRKLAKQTGYRFRWRKTHDVPLIYDEGIAVLSRWPISWSDSTTLPHPESVGLVKRAILGARIEHPERTFELFTTHMTVDGSAKKKTDQIKALHTFVQRHRKTPSSWLVGDFNAAPESPAIEQLRRFADTTDQNGAWTDTWRATRPENEGPTVPTSNPERRIDYVFTIHHPAPNRHANCTRVFKSKIADGNRRIYPSDHLGIYCTFPLESGVTDPSSERRVDAR